MFILCQINKILSIFILASGLLYMCRNLKLLVVALETVVRKAFSLNDGRVENIDKVYTFMEPSKNFLT